MDQAFKIERTRMNTSGEILSSETVHGITSLSSQEISPEAILEGVRGHWGTENKLHYVRDVAFMEDHSQIKDGGSPHVWASLRNLTIDVIRGLGFKDIPSGRRFFGFRTKEYVLKVLGII